jgi:hypothetical protein
MLANRRAVTMRNATVFLRLVPMAGTAGWAFAGSPEGGCPTGPPPEAFKVCEGKNPGDTVQIPTPRGDTISATCRLVAVPQK